MSSIRTELIALDTNEYISALRHPPDSPSVHLVHVQLIGLPVHLPLQVFEELCRNLTKTELNDLHRLLSQNGIIPDFRPGKRAEIEHYENQGAKKGDAAICAQPARFGVTADDLATVRAAFASYVKSCEACKEHQAVMAKSEAALAEAGARLIAAETAQRMAAKQFSTKSRFPH